MITKKIVLLILIAALGLGNEIEESVASLSENMLRELHLQSKSENASKNAPNHQQITGRCVTP